MKNLWVCIFLLCTVLSCSTKKKLLWCAKNAPCEYKTDTVRHDTVVSYDTLTHLPIVKIITVPCASAPNGVVQVRCSTETVQTVKNVYVVQTRTTTVKDVAELNLVLIREDSLKKANVSMINKIQRLEAVKTTWFKAFLILLGVLILAIIFVFLLRKSKP